MRAAAALALVLLALAGCRRDRLTTNDAQIAETIANIAEERPVTKQETPPPALAEIAPPELEGALRPGVRCAFSEGGRLVFASVSGEAVAKMNGQLVHFAASGPTGDTGGYWVTDRFSISIGRATDDGVGAGATTTSPARLVLTDRRRDENAETRLAGSWHCGR
jgi:hypothetical protein